MLATSTLLDNDISFQLQQSVQAAIANRYPLYIHGGNSKYFYGNPVEATPLDVSTHSGIINYEPTELCITLRAGTLLSELEALLDSQNQILPFEPPQYAATSTIGGAIATGISGPRRPYSGSVRDAILGVKIINGNGEIVSFGGQVMKNVAGYDLSRMMVRSQGTLGVILEVSIRLLPKPKHDLTMNFECSQEDALTFFQQSRVRQLPISASAWINDQAYLRLSGSRKPLGSKLALLNKELNATPTIESETLWRDIKNHKHPFFEQADKPLWRLSLPPATKEITRFSDSQLIEWGGAQRWIKTKVPPNIIKHTAQSHNGFATLFQGNIPSEQRFPALEENQMKLHRQLKKNMDPYQIFNPNRMYSDL